MTTPANDPAIPRPSARPAAPAPLAGPPAAARVPPVAVTRGSRRAAARAPLLAGALALLAACNPYVQGNGVLREETRTVDAFEGVVVRDGILVNVTAGATSAPRVSVTVSGDENIVHQSLRTEVRTDAESGLPVLDVYVDMRDFSSAHPLRVSATVPALRVLRASGVHAGSSTQIDATLVRVPVLRVSASDGAIVRLPGAPQGLAADRLDVSLAGGSSGGAWLAAQSCEVGQADVHLDGGATAQIRASFSVTGTVDGHSRLENAGAGPCTGVTASADSTVTCVP